MTRSRCKIFENDRKIRPLEVKELGEAEVDQFVDAIAETIVEGALKALI